MDSLFVALPDYYTTPVKPRGFTEFCEMLDWSTLGPGPHALWELTVTDRFTDRVLQRIWQPNVVTDTGATAMLKNTWNNAGSAVGIFNQIALSPNAGSTTLTMALSNGVSSGTSLAVAALPAAIASGTTITVGFGTGNTQNFVTTALASALATSISVTAQNANFSYPVGSNVVPVPTTSDNPSSVANAIYSGALSSGAFAFSGTGANNRQVVITFLFSGVSFTAGIYTEMYTTNANPIVTGSTANHLITTQMNLNSGTNVTAVCTEKC